MIKKLLVLTICFMFVGVASGQDKSGSLLKSLQKHTWETGIEISHIKYEEPGVMEEEGWMFGIPICYTYRGWVLPSAETAGGWMLRAEGRFSWGQVDYSSRTAGDTDNIDNFMLEFRGLGGWDFPISKVSMLTPYGGIGYRYLNDDSSWMVSSKGYLGYERESNYLYIPVGIEFITPLKNGWSFGAAVEYDLFLWGKQKSNLGYVPGYYDIENDQEQGYGLRGSVRFHKKSGGTDFTIEPFIRYWDIEQSEPTTDPGGTTWVEPKNDSMEIGIRFIAKF